MSTNSNRTLELTEKSENTNNLPSQNELDNILNEIYKHFDNGTMNKEKFQSYVPKIYKLIESNTNNNNNSNSNNKPKTTEPSEPEIDVNELILSTQLVTSFHNICGRSPKTKLSVSFYSQFFTIINQTKKQQNSIKTVINYCDMKRIICVPDKNNNILLYAELNKEIPLRWRKSSIDCFAIEFKDKETDNEEISISANVNTNLASVIKGNSEQQFCQIISGLCNINIDRHDKNLFRSNTDHLKNIFYIDAKIKFDAVSVYPLKKGILIAPKPLYFISQSRIKYYEYPRLGDGLRYFDLNIVLIPMESTDADAIQKDSKKQKKKNKIIKNNTISFSMIAKKQMDAIDYYFNKMNIQRKHNGKASPNRNVNRNNNNNNNNNSSDSSNDEEMSDNNIDAMDEDITDESDEDYKIEEDKCDYSDSDDSNYTDETNEEYSDMNEESEEEPEEEDIDIQKIDISTNNNKNKNKNKKKSRKQKSPKRRVTRANNCKENKNKKSEKKSAEKIRNKKRKRNEMENNNNNSSLNDSANKRFKCGFGRKTALGRKSVQSKKNTKIMSKSIKKKSKSPKKSPKKLVKNKSESDVEIIEMFPEKNNNNILRPISATSNKNNSNKKSKKKKKNTKKNKKNTKKKKQGTLSIDGDGNNKQRNLYDMFSKNDVDL